MALPEPDDPKNDAPTGFDSETSIERNADQKWMRADLDSPLSVDDVPTSRMLRMWLVANRYELHEELSVGGMGRVYRAIHRDLGRPFAVKLMLENQRARPESRERFFVEARLASALVHPNIVSVTDYGLDEQHGYYLVMELLEGTTARSRMLESRVPPRLAFDIVDQLTGAVRYMHARGILHGDIKPENVFLAKQEGEPRRRNIVKLLDFGLSFRSGGAPEAKLGGSPPYLAPERLQGAPQSPAADVYSLGVVLYELLAGRPLYTGALAEVMEKSVLGPLPRPPSELATMPLEPSVDALVMRALSRDPHARHATAEAFHFELRAVMSMSGLSVRKEKAKSQTGEEAVRAALAAANRGDLVAVKRLLGDAVHRLDTLGAMPALVEDDDLLEDA